MPLVAIGHTWSTLLRYCDVVRKPAHVMGRSEQVLGWQDRTRRGADRRRPLAPAVGAVTLCPCARSAGAVIPTSPLHTHPDARSPTNPAGAGRGVWAQGGAQGRASSPSVTCSASADTMGDERRPEAAPAGAEPSEEEGSRTEPQPGADAGAEEERLQQVGAAPRRLRRCPLHCTAAAAAVCVSRAAPSPCRA